METQQLPTRTESPNPTGAATSTPPVYPRYSDGPPAVVHVPPKPHYGQSCTNCFKSRQKCIYSPRGRDFPCERCHRLEKQCIPGERKRTIKTAPRNRTAQLEGSLDEIVSLLREGHTVKQLHDDKDRLALTNHLNAASASQPSPNGQTDSSNQTDNSNTPAPSAPRPNVNGTPSLIDYVSQYSIPDSRAAEQLNRFRRDFLRYFAFCHIPYTVGSAELRRQKPFLWLVIMSLTTRSVSEQAVMGDTIRSIVSQKVVAQHDKSLDLLQGLLCVLSWYQYHKRDKPYLVMWTQLAVAMAFQLGLHRAPRQLPGDGQPPAEEGQLLNKADWIPGYPPVHETRSMEERRAIVSLYIITSMAWITLRQMEPLRRTPYVEECIHILRNAPEIEPDILLATQAKCHTIMDHVTRARADRTAEGHTAQESSNFLTEALQSQLQDMRRALPPELQGQRAVLLNFYATEIIITEAVINKPTTAPSTSVSVPPAPIPNPGTNSTEPNLAQLMTLSNLLHTIQQYFILFHRANLAEWTGQTFAIYSQFSHCILLLYKLSTLKIPGWDTAYVRRTVNILDILEQLVYRLEMLPSYLGIKDGEENSMLYKKGAAMIRGMKNSFAKDLQAFDEAEEKERAERAQRAEMEKARGDANNASNRDGAGLMEVHEFGDGLAMEGVMSEMQQEQPQQQQSMDYDVFGGGWLEVPEDLALRFPDEEWMLDMLNFQGTYD